MPTYNAWDLGMDVPDRILVVWITNRIGGLEIGIISGDGDSDFGLIIRFKNPLGYWVCDERMKCAVWDDIRLSEQQFRPFLVIADSELGEYLVRQSGGLCERSDFQHYAIHSGEECIDILSQEAPLVRSVSRAEVVGCDDPCTS